MKFGWIIGFLFLFACQQPDAVRIACAANLIGPLEEICASYQERTGQNIQLSFGASGLLRTQVQQGAPFDLFVSANPLFASQLDSAGLTLTEPEPIAFGGIIGWQRRGAFGTWEEALRAKSPGEKICLPNPDLAPYGAAARTWLEQAGLWAQLESDLVFAESVGQANQFIRSGAVSWAMTASSAQYLPEIAQWGHWYTLEEPARINLAQTMVLLKRAKTGTLDFAAYLKGREAGAVFEKYGYRMIQN